MCNVTSMKEGLWYQPSFEYKIVHKAIRRHIIGKEWSSFNQNLIANSISREYEM